MTDALTSILSEIKDVDNEDINFRKVTAVTIEEVDGVGDEDAGPTLVVKEVAATAPTAKGKLCLNMIVKNESKIIERLMTSVLSIIDCYCITDTGSTDNTVEIIRTFMADHKIPGEVIIEPFKNFGYNRTFALDAAARWGEYALLLDADMKLVIEPTFSKDQLTGDGYAIIQKAGNMEYSNTRIVKTGIGVKCVGYTHEYYDFPPGTHCGTLKTLWINDIGDGGAKADKFERDIRLLKMSLEEDPKNVRSWFYLANSYRDLGRHEEAIAAYKKRIELGGWVEETFYACYELGNQYRELKDWPNAIYWWLEAYDRRPERAESLLEVVRHYRIVGKQRAAQLILDKAIKIPYPKDDLLFIRSDTYSHLLMYEQSILSYYSRAPVDHYKYLELIGHDYAKGNVLSNYKFYVNKLKDHCVKDIDFCGKAEKMIMGRNDDFVSSSPCIIPHSEGYLLNIRYVNYTIRPDGSYAFKHSDGKITTLNLLHWLNKDFKPVRSHWLDKVTNEHLRYQGVEDVKVFSHCGDLLFLGTVENPENGNVAVGHGKYDYTADRLVPTPFASPHNRGCEKNWCYFHNYDGDLRIVYEWSPLTIYEVDGPSSIKKLQSSTKVPAFFRDIRGSTNGVMVGDEVWFVCHLVEYTTPRHYYHIIVVLDSKTMEYKRHSIMFKFHGDCIEYCLGFVVEQERFIFSYSKMDRTSAVMVLDRTRGTELLFPKPAA
jgi:tetratricopeptide (TPR) repeat protein